MVKEVTIYTDGACSGNPGPGGWGTILKYGEHQKEISGGEAQTTNNRMELTAVIEGLKLLNQECNVTVYSDSKYVCDAFNQGWVYNWMKKGWKKADNKPVLNRELWEELLSEMRRHKVKFVWVKGHAENEYNNRCDQMAVAESNRKKAAL